MTRPAIEQQYEEASLGHATEYASHISTAMSMAQDAKAYHGDRETAKAIVEMAKHNPAAAKAAYDVFMEQKTREAVHHSAPSGARDMATPVREPK